MSVNMHVREVPDEVHAELQRRAAATGMTLRQYTIDVLEAHCQIPTVDDWLDAVVRRRIGSLVDGADAVRAARHESEDRIERAVVVGA